MELAGTRSLTFTALELDRTSEEITKSPAMTTTTATMATVQDRQVLVHGARTRPQGQGTRLSAP